MIKDIGCVNHFLGRCRDCVEDFDKGHHPNNFDCPRFILMHIFGFEVIEVIEKDNSIVILKDKKDNLGNLGNLGDLGNK